MHCYKALYAPLRHDPSMRHASIPEEGIYTVRGPVKALVRGWTRQESNLQVHRPGCDLGSWGPNHQDQGITHLPHCGSRGSPLARRS